MARYEYRYPDGTTELWDSQIIRGKIYAAFDTDPTNFPEFVALDGGTDAYWVTFERDLTPSEKTILDGVMNKLDVGVLPTTTGWTVIRFPDIMNNWKALETNSQLDINFVWFNSKIGKYEMWINTSVSSAKLNKVKSGVMDLVEVITK